MSEAAKSQGEKQRAELSGVMILPAAFLAEIIGSRYSARSTWRLWRRRRRKTTKLPAPRHRNACFTKEHDCQLICATARFQARLLIEARRNVKLVVNPQAGL